ncbi:MAG: orotate phosphoribosyltransferase [Gammaproteobacteria bacterium]|nr:orotate phosphoribosyltransferase [Gammaproteobacteria bacterium]
MSDTRNNFINLCLENSILKFGEYVLKSGRVSPYFFNAGGFDDGHLLSELSKFYASSIVENIPGDFMLYGPAYKGIPLACATALQLSQVYQKNISYAFNRKEEKDHGEGGNLVGAPLSGNVVILDDVITAGTSVNESFEVIQNAGATPSAVVIALDRQEIADNQTLSAVQRVEHELNIPVYSLIKLNDLVNFLSTDQHSSSHIGAVTAYRKKYSIL